MLPASIGFGTEGLGMVMKSSSHVLIADGSLAQARVMSHCDSSYLYRMHKGTVQAMYIWLELRHSTVGHAGPQAEDPLPFS